jgi:hypothetical protein
MAVSRTVAMADSAPQYEPAGLRNHGTINRQHEERFSKYANRIAGKQNNVPLSDDTRNTHQTQQL